MLDDHAFTNPPREASPIDGYKSHAKGREELAFGIGKEKRRKIETRERAKREKKNGFRLLSSLVEVTQKLPLSLSFYFHLFSLYLHFVVKMMDE